jgi:hypothetical protein
MKAVNRTLVVLGLVLLAVGASAQVQRYGQGDWQSRQLIRRLEDRMNLFRNSLNAAMNQDGLDSARAEENISRFVADFDDALRRFHDRFDRRQAMAADAQEVLDRASSIDRFMRRHTLDSRTQNYWANIRGDLNQLARAYNVTWPTMARMYPTYPTTQTYPTRPTYSGARLTGTYRLDSSRSDDPGDAADRALRSLSYADQQRMRDQMLRRLEPPEEIAIEVRGRTVSLASTKAPQISFAADGLERTETTANGRSIQARAMLNGDQLTVSTTGDRNLEFNVTFSAIENGRRLSVTRRVYAEGLRQPAVVQSYYDRTSDVARFGIYSGRQDYPTTGDNRDFIIRNGETLVAELNDPLSTGTTRDGDRFTATVRMPTQYAGATIEGHVSGVQRSGRLSGRSEMTFNFDRIRLRDGRSYPFAGFVTTVSTPNGETARVDNEGAIQEESQTRKTTERAAIGTAVGAIIGAIAGGGKGAAIGAIVGAGGGAGSVYIQGRDDLDLPRGSEITIQATGPQ